MLCCKLHCQKGSNFILSRKILNPKPQPPQQLLVSVNEIWVPAGTLLLYSSRAKSWVIKKSMRLEYEPSSEPLRNSVK